jgi:hypothetical protein
MGECFENDDVYPIIARLIRAISQTADWATRDAVAAGLISDEVGARMVQSAVRRCPGRDAEVHAGNMVDWWSKDITEGRSQYEREFERRKIGRKWAYRPVSAGSTITGQVSVPRAVAPSRLELVKHCLTSGHSPSADAIPDPLVPARTLMPRVDGWLPCSHCGTFVKTGELRA